MAIVLGDLIKFNAVESTDPIMGVLQVPYAKPIAFIPNVTYSTEYEEKTLTDSGRGSQVLIRRLGAITATQVSVSASGALDFSHVETADELDVVQLDKVTKHSEKLYEAVESARESKTGAAKAEVVLNAILDGVQKDFTSKLEDAASASPISTVLTKDNIYERLLVELAKLDYKPDTLQVSREVYALLLQLVTTGHFLANSAETSFRTGVLGTIAGMNVVINDHLTGDFVMYNHNHFQGFTLFNSFDVVPSTTFKGSYIRGMIISGAYGRYLEHNNNVGRGNGMWGIAYNKGTQFILTFDSKGGSPVAPIKVKGSTAIPKPVAPTKEGYTFDKWVTADGGSTAFNFSNGISENTTIYAKWTQKD